MEATVDPQPRGPDWMPITPKTGFLFHADSQSFAQRLATEARIHRGRPKHEGSRRTDESAQVRACRDFASDRREWGISGQPIPDQFEDATRLPADAASSLGNGTRPTTQGRHQHIECLYLRSRGGRDRLSCLARLFFLIIQFFRAQRRKRQHDFFQKLPVRIADIVWTNDKRKGGVAKTAIEAYCDCVEGLMNGFLRADYPIDGCHLGDAQKPAHRALQIAWATTNRRSPLPDRVIAVLTSLYAQALKDAQPVIFSRIVQASYTGGSATRKASNAASWVR
jgi:hypothetical protein